MGQGQGQRSVEEDICTITVAIVEFSTNKLSFWITYVTSYFSIIEFIKWTCWVRYSSMVYFLPFVHFIDKRVKTRFLERDIYHSLSDVV